MKNTILILILLLGMWGCSDDDSSAFEASVPRENISFKAVPGGAVMYYNLKGNKDVYSIRARYTDARGKELVIDGSYLSDSLVLVGFNEAKENVPVYLSFLNRELESSGEEEMHFSTEDSAPVAFFNKVKVEPGWNGFSVIYDAPEATGYAHVFYLGENPLTHEMDTLWLQTISIAAGGDTLSFSLQQEREYNTVVIATEDFRGYRVKQQIWENVEAYAITQFPSRDIALLDPCNIVVEDETLCLGSKYLFDGDSKGIQRLSVGTPKTQYCTFTTGKNSLGKYWVLDLGEEQIIAKLRMYAAYTYDMRWLGWLWVSKYFNKLPSEVTIYGSNDMNDETSWVKLAYFYESPLIPGWGEKSKTSVNDAVLLERADPIYTDIVCAATQQGYRYIKMVVHDTPHPSDDSDKNKNKVITLSELEVYVKK